MRRLWFTTRIAIAAVVGLCGALLRRLRQGPTLPTWTWSAAVAPSAEVTPQG